MILDYSKKLLIIIIITKFRRYYILINVDNRLRLFLIVRLVKYYSYYIVRYVYIDIYLLNRFIITKN